MGPIHLVFVCRLAQPAVQKPVWLAGVSSRLDRASWPGQLGRLTKHDVWERPFMGKLIKSADPRDSGRTILSWAGVK